MIENYEHYISKNIKAFYKRRLFSPIIYLILLLALWLIFPLADMRHPETLSTEESLRSVYSTSNRYVTASLSDLEFTGYTKTRMGATVGYYYYCNYGNQVIIVLLSPYTCEQIGRAHV